MKLLRIPEVAKILDVSVERAYQLARTEAIPVVRLGRQLRVDAEQLPEMDAERRSAAPGGWRREA